MALREKFGRIFRKSKAPKTEVAQDPQLANVYEIPESTSKAVAPVADTTPARKRAPGEVNPDTDTLTPEQKAIRNDLMSLLNAYDLSSKSEQKRMRDEMSKTGDASVGGEAARRGQQAAFLSDALGLSREEGLEVFKAAEAAETTPGQAVEPKRESSRDEIQVYTLQPISPEEGRKLQEENGMSPIYEFNLPEPSPKSLAKPETGPKDLNSPEGVAMHMAASTSSEDWNRRADEIKKANGGNYPTCWYQAVMLSGLMSKVSSNW